MQHRSSSNSSESVMARVVVAVETGPSLPPPPPPAAAPVEGVGVPPGWGAGALALAAAAAAVAVEVEESLGGGGGCGEPCTVADAVADAVREDSRDSAGDLVAEGEPVGDVDAAGDAVDVPDADAVPAPGEAVADEEALAVELSLGGADASADADGEPVGRDERDAVVVCVAERDACEVGVEVGDSVDSGDADSERRAVAVEEAVGDGESRVDAEKREDGVLPSREELLEEEADGEGDSESVGAPGVGVAAGEGVSPPPPTPPPPLPGESVLPCEALAAPEVLREATADALGLPVMLPVCVSGAEAQGDGESVPLPTPAPAPAPAEDVPHADAVRDTDTVADGVPAAPAAPAAPAVPDEVGDTVSDTVPETVVDAHSDAVFVVVSEPERVGDGVIEPPRDALGEAVDDCDALTDGVTAPERETVLVVDRENVDDAEVVLEGSGDGDVDGDELGERDGDGEDDGDGEALVLAVCEALPDARKDIDARPVTLPPPLAVPDWEEERDCERVGVAEGVPTSLPGPTEEVGELVLNMVAVAFTVALEEWDGERDSDCVTLTEDVAEALREGDTAADAVAEAQVVREDESDSVGVDEEQRVGDVVEDTLTVLLSEAVGDEDTTDDSEELLDTERDTEPDTDAVGVREDDGDEHAESVLVELSVRNAEALREADETAETEPSPPPPRDELETRVDSVGDGDALALDEELSEAVDVGDAVPPAPLPRPNDAVIDDDAEAHTVTVALRDLDGLLVADVLCDTVDERLPVRVDELHGDSVISADAVWQRDALSEPVGEGDTVPPAPLARPGETLGDDDAELQPECERVSSGVGLTDAVALTLGDGVALEERDAETHPDADGELIALPVNEGLPEGVRLPQPLALGEPECEGLPVELTVPHRVTLNDPVGQGDAVPPAPPPRLGLRVSTLELVGAGVAELSPKALAEAVAHADAHSELVAVGDTNVSADDDALGQPEDDSDGLSDADGRREVVGDKDVDPLLLTVPARGVGDGDTLSDGDAEALRDKDGEPEPVRDVDALAELEGDRCEDRDALAHAATEAVENGDGEEELVPPPPFPPRTPDAEPESVPVDVPDCDSHRVDDSVGDDDALVAALVDAAAESESKPEALFDSVPQGEDVDDGDPEAQLLALGEPLGAGDALTEDDALRERLFVAQLLAVTVPLADAVAHAVPAGVALIEGEPHADAVARADALCDAEPEAQPLALGEPLVVRVELTESVAEREREGDADADAHGDTVEDRDAPLLREVLPTSDGVGALEVLEEALCDADSVAPGLADTEMEAVPVPDALADLLPKPLRDSDWVADAESEADTEPLVRPDTERDRVGETVDDSDGDTLGEPDAEPVALGDSDAERDREGEGVTLDEGESAPLALPLPLTDDERVGDAVELGEKGSVEGIAEGETLTEEDSHALTDAESVADAVGDADESAVSVRDRVATRVVAQPDREGVADRTADADVQGVPDSQAEALPEVVVDGEVVAELDALGETVTEADMVLDLDTGASDWPLLRVGRLLEDDVRRGEEDRLSDELTDAQGVAWDDPEELADSDADADALADADSHALTEALRVGEGVADSVFVAVLVPQPVGEVERERVGDVVVLGVNGCVEGMGDSDGAPLRDAAPGVDDTVKVTDAELAGVAEPEPETQIVAKRVVASADGDGLRDRTLDADAHAEPEALTEPVLLTDADTEEVSSGEKLADTLGDCDGEVLSDAVRERVRLGDAVPQRDTEPLLLRTDAVAHEVREVLGDRVLLVTAEALSDSRAIAEGLPDTLMEALEDTDALALSDADALLVGARDAVGHTESETLFVCDALLAREAVAGAVALPLTLGENGCVEGMAVAERVPHPDALPLPSAGLGEEPLEPLRLGELLAEGLVLAKRVVARPEAELLRVSD